MALAATSDQHTASKRAPLFSLIVEVVDKMLSENGNRNRHGCHCEEMYMYMQFWYTT